MKLKQVTIALKWLAKTGYRNWRFVELYKDLNGLYYLYPVKAKLLNGMIVSISTMKGGVELRVSGERYFLRRDHFNNEIYLQREEVGTGEWDNLPVWAPDAKPALKVLKSLIRHNPYVPSDEGARYVG